MSHTQPYFGRYNVSGIIAQNHLVSSVFSANVIPTPIWLVSNSCKLMYLSTHEGLELTIWYLVYSKSYSTPSTSSKSLISNSIISWFSSKSESSSSDPVGAESRLSRVFAAPIPSPVGSTRREKGASVSYIDDNEKGMSCASVSLHSSPRSNRDLKIIHRRS